MPKQIEELREALFATLADLRDKEKPLDLDRAKAIVHVAQVIVDSARVEVDFARVVGGTGTGFIPVQIAAPKEPPLRVHHLK